MLKIRIKSLYSPGIKFGILLFIFYESFYTYVVGHSSVIMYGSIFISVFFVVMDLLEQGRKIEIEKQYNFPMALVAYLIYSAITALFVAKDVAYSFDALKMFLGFVVAVYCVYYVSEQENDYGWVLFSFFVVAFFCAIYLLITGGSVTQGRISLVEGQNVNGLAVTMLCGIYGVVTDKKFTSDKHFLLKIILCCLFVYVIIQTASRKALISSVVFLLLWLIFYFKDTVSRKKNIFTIINYFLIVAGIAFVIYYYFAEFQNTVAFERLNELSGEEKDQSSVIRIDMYKTAIKYWLTSPIFGIGYKHFEVYYGVYSHSTYAEILACGGIIGCLIFFVPIIKNIKILVSRIFSKKYNMFFYDYSVLLIMLACELFMGVGQIFIYEYNHLFLLAYIFGSIKILDDKCLYETNKKCE